MERLTHTIGEMNCSVTVAGDEHLRKLQTSDDDAQATRSEMAFVAMWFAEEMDDPDDRGIAPAIRDAGYEPELAKTIPERVARAARPSSSG